MKPGRSLQGRITLGVIGYVLLLGMAVMAYGWVIVESAEELVWSSLLETGMDHVARNVDDATALIDHTGLLHFYQDRDGAPMPPVLADLVPGLHDDQLVDGRESVVLVRDVDGRRLVLALDITEFEQLERDLGLKLLLSGVLMATLLGAAATWGVARLLRPLRELADGIRGLRPDAAEQRIRTPDDATEELVLIADALNAYLQRHDEFVERERAFIDSASHELRTPLAVISGATELALDAEMPASARLQLHRIQRTLRGVEELIAMLLVLAKDPAHLARSSDRIELDQLLPEIAEDHRHLCRDKDLQLRVLPMPPCEIVAPVAIVQATVGNLLRNAIENSDSGEVTVSLQADGVVVIEDPGQGMSPEQISAIYARQAHGHGRAGSGLGLELITRLCRHLGWKLLIAPRDGVRGTRATVDLGASLSGKGGAR